jgi:hypothetical protein
MYANILLSTDGSDVARKGDGIALAKGLNAKVTVIARVRHGRHFLSFEDAKYRVVQPG